MTILTNLLSYTRSYVFNPGPETFFKLQGNFSFSDCITMYTTKADVLLYVLTMSERRALEVLP